jgi:hypothetical protein
MPRDAVRSGGDQAVALEEVHADAVALAERPHGPRSEDRRPDRDPEARKPNRHREVCREREKIRNHERHPDEWRVVLQEPRALRADQVPARSSHDPQRPGREKDDVSGQQHTDAESAVVHGQRR